MQIAGAYKSDAMLKIDLACLQQLTASSHRALLEGVRHVGGRCSVIRAVAQSQGLASASARNAFRLAADIGGAGTSCDLREMRRNYLRVREWP